jgi:hypothetical protein
MKQGRIRDNYSFLSFKLLEGNGHEISATPNYNECTLKMQIICVTVELKTQTPELKPGVLLSSRR